MAVVNFDELIGTKTFDAAFKNTIRDYYVYGFKSSKNEFSQSASAVENRWKTLSKSLGDKWSFHNNDGRKYIELETSSFGLENPVDDLYFYHNLQYFGEYLTYLLILDSNSYLRNGIAALPIDCEALDQVKYGGKIMPVQECDEVTYAIISNWQKQLENMEKKEPVYRISRQLAIWTKITRDKLGLDVDSKHRYKTLEYMVGKLYELGVVGDLRDDTAKRNAWLKAEWEEYSIANKNSADKEHHVTKRYFNSKKSRVHYWFKSTLTMRNLLKEADKEKNESDFRLMVSFKEMCDFFSQYYPLGTFGKLLSERCEGQFICDNDIFRIKNNYIQKNLYSYNLIDLIIAIENEYFCLIKYTHGTNLRTSEILAIPLEIRISVINGREYVLYYDPEYLTIGSIRLEFIDKITIYTKITKGSKIVNTHNDKGNNVSKKEIKSLLDKKSQEIKKKIIIAKEMLPYIWGVETPKNRVGKKWKKNLVEISLPIIYDEINERYIKNRINKEKRNISDITSFEVFPTKEIRNWVRSFYMRLDVASDKTIGELNISKDVESMKKVYMGDKLIFKNFGAINEVDYILGHKEETAKITDYSEIKYEIIGKVLAEPHDTLFNELFSNYAIVLADSVLESSDEKASVNIEKCLSNNIDKRLSYLSNSEKQITRDVLIQLLKNSELINKNRQTRFVMKGGSKKENGYLHSLLPLTKMECRWLITVLEDPLAHIFLTDEQINVLKDNVNNVQLNVNPINMECINYYDRYNLIDRSNIYTSKLKRYSDNDIKTVKTIYNAIREGKKILFMYTNGNEKSYMVKCSPVYLEYSRRDDVFRLECVNADKKYIVKYNIPRISKIKNLEESFDIKYSREMYEKIYKENILSIDIDFYEGEKNILDRLLTEFSIWKKTCRYDIEKNKYTMKLNYNISDEKEILIRLLGYGPYIKIRSSSDNYILSELQRRIDEQYKIIKGNDRKLVNTDKERQ